MSQDLAFDPNTGDLVLSPNVDIQFVLGDQVVAQRIRNRVRIERGWDYDPTDGTLGSRVMSGVRMNMARATTEIPLLVKEALAPMTDVNVVSVEAEPSQDDSHQLLVHIKYEVIDQSDVMPAAQEAVEEQITVQLSV